MKRKAVLFVPVFTIMILFGCEGLFLTNYFRSFEDTSTRISENPTIEEIEDVASSPDFYNNLTKDSEEKARVIEILEKYASEGTNAEKQSASLILADVYLKTDPKATTIISNLAVVLMHPESVDTGNISENPLALVGSILPPELIPPEGSLEGSSEYDKVCRLFVQSVISLAKAGEAYEIFGSTLSPNGEATVPQGTVIGAVCQNAIVCIIMNEVLDQISAGNSGCSDAEAAEILFNSLYGSGADPFPEGFDDSRIMSDGSSLFNILNAAGLDDVFNQEGTSSVGIAGEIV